VIVALTVIVIVSAAAVVLIAAQIRAETKAARTITATNMAENAVECFRYACDAEGAAEAFEDAFGNSGCGYALTETETDTEYTAKHNGVTGYFTIDFNRKTIKVEIRNTDGETIVSVENYKG
jgi:type II secretory pathway pseudopilin PulG